MILNMIAKGSGGGGSGFTVNDYITHNLTGQVECTEETIQYILLAKQNGITSISFPNVTNLNTNNVNETFAYMTGLLSFSAPKVTRIKDYALRGCASLTSVELPKLEDTGGGLLYECTSIQTVVLPSVKVIYSQAFRSCSNLETLDVLASTGFTSTNTMYGCGKLKTLIIRKTGGAASLSNINTFTSTPFASGGSGGTLYVPNNLISTYQSASNWSTILGYANNQIKKIEGTIYETHYADGKAIS